MATKKSLAIIQFPAHALGGGELKDGDKFTFTGCYYKPKESPMMDHGTDKPSVPLQVPIHIESAMRVKRTTTPAKKVGGALEYAKSKNTGKAMEKEMAY